ncbi:Myb-like DNA-binding domain containing protein [Tritrichomonas foetus]|uniref:Myb-like DNA-binding domain containing protein n=1 Tax=Tritrichomonas foetus TaxID=1144522 RepID=A0A1J4JJG6_9EUKA|nr:Myb-like DNA-binding domain containing protein [Tritrichomonas foetus]|eukprot:OHS97709.1 Myb-like DNA-binding domain containing protein [Tritrichomonas foetus]
MTSKFAGLEFMVELALSYVDGTVSDLAEETKTELTHLFNAYLHEEMSYESCRDALISHIGRDDALVRIREIMSQPDEPLPYREDRDSEDAMSLRKKTRTWTAIEDQRLLAGVARFGIDNWQTVAHFLGNGRNRAQCSQRWTRCLNPKISKKSWSPEDDRQLKELVNLYGDKSWTKTANIMGNRSDVQCRYHFRQLTTGEEEPGSLTKTMSSENFNLQSPPAPSDPSSVPDELMMPLTRSRGFSSTPSLVVKQDTPLLLPLAPIVNRRRCREATTPSVEISGQPKMLWGVTGTDEQSLSTFLSNFH